MGNVCGLGGIFWEPPLPPPPSSSEVPHYEQPSFGDLTRYDIFLNHRGPDVKKTFVSQLEDALCRAGHEPFLDAKSLIKGQDAMRSINEALTGVQVHVAVFSPRYAESKYCLNELCDMLESHKSIIPVFYNVEPENLRWTKQGPFAKAFDDHMKKGRNELVVRWKASLLAAAGITGFRLANNENDTLLIKKVVRAVCDAFPAPLPRPVALHPVGLKESSMHVIKVLHDMGDNVGVMGICGTGGIGKTTLAKEVYKQEQSRFESTCFLNDVKEAKGVAVMDLQAKMVMDLLHVDAKKVNWNFDHWFEKIRKRKVLIVIDDINERKQLDALILDVKELAPGSRILITCRDQDIIKKIRLDVPKSELYDVPKLSLLDSMDLFVWCAFRKNSIGDVDVAFLEFVTQIARACDGLPLALEVMGGFLVDKKIMPEDMNYWEDAIFELHKNGDIISKLQMSYNGLANNIDKRMFLDIACFMLGHPKQVAMEIWESSGDYGRSSSWSLSRLINKNLVKVDAKEQLVMHDLLRDMGRHIVLERAHKKHEIQSHVWDPSIGEEILQKKKVLNEVLALNVAGTTSFTTYKAENYAHLVELRYLLLDGCSINGEFSGWSQELKWLQWQYIPCQILPSSLKLPNLIVLDLSNSDRLTHVWADDFEVDYNCKKLHILILENCANLKELPRNINAMVKLKFLNLKRCSSLRSLPESLGDLADLEHLNLSWCTNLTTFPNVRCLSSLKELKMRGCMTWPKSFSTISNLEILNLSYCSLLENLPTSVCKLKKLELLMEMTDVEELPEDIGNLHSLTRINLSMCRSLRKLPESFSNLSNLEYLDLSGCTLLHEIPHSICAFKKMKWLYMGTTSVEVLPEDIGNLHSLIVISLSECGSLRKLPESFSNLSNLEYLNLSGCTLLHEIPHSTCAFKKLKELHMDGTSVEVLPEDIGNLLSLTSINL